METQRFEYDQNGRLRRIVRDGQDQVLSWDALDRLVRIETWRTEYDTERPHSSLGNQTPNQLEQTWRAAA